MEEEIIVLLFLALLKRRVKAEEKKAPRVVVGVVIFVSPKDDAFGDDASKTGDGADERRSPTALGIFFRMSAKKLPLFCIGKLTF